MGSSSLIPTDCTSPGRSTALSWAKLFVAAEFSGCVPELVTVARHDTTGRAFLGEMHRLERLGDGWVEIRDVLMAAAQFLVSIERVPGDSRVMSHGTVASEKLLSALDVLSSVDLLVDRGAFQRARRLLVDSMGDELTRPIPRG